MAGETQKTTALTNRNSGIVRAARLAGGTVKVGIDTHQFAAATELQAADNLIMDIPIPSNAVIVDVESFHDDMDTHACAPTLTISVGLAAREKFESVTSGTKTVNAVDAILDADVLVDAVTTMRAAVTSFTSLVPNATLGGAEDRTKAVWQLLGYDEDPHTVFNIVVQSEAASAALGSAADMTIKVTYIVD